MIVQAFARQTIIDIAISAVAIYRLNFWTFLVVFALPQALDFSIDIAIGPQRPWLTELLFFFVSLVLGTCAYVAAVRVAAGAVDGNPVGLCEALTWMWRAPLLKIIVATLVVVVGLVAGLALFIIPGIIVAVRALYFALPFLFERTGIRTSLIRSSDLVRGNFWHSAAILLVFAGVPYVLFPVLIVLVENEGLSLVILTTAIGALSAPLFPIASVLGYVEMRGVKDGYVPDHLHAELETGS